MARTRAKLAARSCVAVVPAHAAAVTAVAFAPRAADDGEEGATVERDQLLATSGTDGSVKLWWIPNGDAAASLGCVSSDESNAEHPVTALAWAPREVDGRLRLAAATVTGALSLWHLARIERDDDDARHEDAPFIQYGDLITDRKRRRHCVIRDEDREAAVCQGAHLGLQRGHGHRVHPRKRLIKEQHPRPHHERSSDLGAPTLTAAEGRLTPVSDMRQLEPLHHLLGSVSRLGC